MLSKVVAVEVVDSALVVAHLDELRLMLLF
jgi:hypothetical protein